MLSTFSMRSAADKWRSPWPCMVAIISFLLLFTSSSGCGRRMRIHHPSPSLSHPGDDGIVSEGSHIPSITDAMGGVLSTSQIARQHLEHDCRSEGRRIRGGGENERVVASWHKPVQRASSLHVLLFTWNLGEISPPAEDCKFISEMAAQDDADVVCLAVQEVENIKPRRHEGRRSREWNRLQLKALGHSVRLNLFVDRYLFSQ